MCQVKVTSLDSEAENMRNPTLLDREVYIKGNRTTFGQGSVHQKGIGPPLDRDVYIKGNRTTFGQGSVHQRE